ncbi:MAG: hypothetical protein M3Y65_16465 [Pseudomonadota bacterium]|nr:hypothetical protein [Pseudomonadota bacterium]
MGFKAAPQSSHLLKSVYQFSIAAVYQFTTAADKMSLHVLAYNFKRLIAILGIADMMKAIRAFMRLRRVKTAMQAIFESIVTRSLKKNIAPLRASWVFQIRQQLR